MHFQRAVLQGSWNLYTIYIYVSVSTHAPNLASCIMSVQHHHWSQAIKMFFVLKWYQVIFSHARMSSIELKSEIELQFAQQPMEEKTK